MNKIQNFTCPYCNKCYTSLDNMYSCAKRDEQVNQQKQIQLSNQAKEYYKIIGTKIKEINEAIDKYNSIITQCGEVGKAITHCMINTQKTTEKETKKSNKEDKKVIKNDKDEDDNNDTFMNLIDFIRYICEEE